MQQLSVVIQTRTQTLRQARAMERQTEPGSACWDHQQ